MNAEIMEMINDMLDANVPFVLDGPPGIGKTTGVERIGRVERRGHVETIIASGMEPSDLGYPVNMGDGVVKCALPAFAKRCIDAVAEGKFCILLIDEASQIHPAMQAALLELVRVGRVNSDWSLPPQVRRVLAMNGTDCGGQHDFLAPLASRMGHIKVAPDVQGFSEWLIGQTDPHNMIPTLLAFFKSKPTAAVNVPKEALQQSGPYPTFRSWFNATRCRTDAARAALVGPIYAEFVQFQKMNDLPDPAAVCDGTADLPTRPDARYATLVAVSALGTREAIKYGKKAWKVIVGVANDGSLDEALVPARALALAVASMKNSKDIISPAELGKLGPALSKILR